MQPLQHVMNAAACIIMDLSVCNHAKPVVKLLSREFCTSCVYMCTLLTPDTTTILRPFFRDHPGWAGARRELLVDFMVQGEINRGRHTDHPAGRHSIRTNQCPHPPSPIFFSGRMPFLPPNQQCQSTEGTGQASQYLTNCILTVSAAASRYRLSLNDTEDYVLARTRTKFVEFLLLWSSGMEQSAVRSTRCHWH